jgi:hypothetical protein
MTYVHPPSRPNLPETWKNGRKCLKSVNFHESVTAPPARRAYDVAISRPTRGTLPRIPLYQLLRDDFCRPVSGAQEIRKARFVRLVGSICRPEHSSPMPPASDRAASSHTTVRDEFGDDLDGLGAGCFTAPGTSSSMPSLRISRRLMIKC